MDRFVELYKTYEGFTCLVTVDPNGLITSMNQNFLLGIKQNDLTCLFDICSGQFDKDYYERIFKHVLNGYPWRDEVRFQNEKGEVFWLDCQILANSKGNEIFIVGIDVTQRKENETLIQEQRKQLFVQSQFSALGEMASGIAHEINNPLSIISALAHLLKDLAEKDNLNKKSVLDIFGNIESTVKRISSIIKGLRNIARNPTKDEAEYICFQDILNDVFPLFEEKFKSKGIEIRKELPVEVIQKKTMLQKVQISQVLINLLNNSFDEILDKELESPWVLIGISLKNEKFTVEVRDCGNGIEESVRQKIFNPFYTQKDIGKGTGLGLSLSLSMIQRHEGNLWVDESSPNTSFKFTIPLKLEPKASTHTIETKV